MDIFRNLIRNAVEEQLNKSCYDDDIFLAELTDWVRDDTSDTAVMEAISGWLENTEFLYWVEKYVGEQVEIEKWIVPFDVKYTAKFV